MIVLGVFEMPKQKIVKWKLDFNAGHTHFPESIFSILQGFSTLITLCQFTELQLLVFTVVANTANRKDTYILLK